MSFEAPQIVEGQKTGFEVGSRGIEPNRPTLILIHGSGGSRHSWPYQIEGLDESINVAALELPGHGESPEPLRPTVSECAQWVARVLETWQLPAPPVVGGHSLGGAITLELGLTRPDLTGGLILVGTGAHLPVNPALFDGLKNDFGPTVRLIIKWSFAKTTDDAVTKAAAEQLELNQPETIINDLRACDRFDRRQDLSRINRPTLIVCGQQDKMTPIALSDFMAENITSAQKAYIDQAGHMVAGEQPETFNRAVNEFVVGLG